MAEQKAAFVTGAGSGIGRAIARKLAANGFAVAIADVRLEAAEETVSLLSADGGQGIAVACDVTDLAAVQAAVSETKARLGRIDVLVNNAGWDKVEPFLESQPDTWDRIIRINLLGQIHTCKAVLPVMIEQGGGKVINIASDAGRVGSTGEAVYSAAKGGVIAFTKTIAREMARHRINVNCVAPGPANTPLFQEIGTYNPGIRTALEKAIPFRRLAEPEDIAGAVAYFASEDAAYVTGQTLSVSGGLTMV
ncbi:glucose 1-dehydrogenase [Alicyclobacillus cycloheptanicus]|uniref:2-hydroxycyclohexanecarboxyl-CoA dehydrogenase n=1 Tax=Alicyclobacillus cycloheptanicus TaxID=1457 RepID=A0ABT9XF55_9BACL|nr:3-oxoacyl-ACP reductase family protein [Alicyclobacillus cycloheptanicus]MDQ0188933.1 2-hydroxycyclohexanecarboxyl-CoA dehydrogenase [Alicyclobacillus cycloheptanicus]WDM01718.1 glucose 1-dehydrogenase [Alicyclobacillus cycloheptanicus]